DKLRSEDNVVVRVDDFHTVLKVVPDRAVAHKHIFEPGTLNIDTVPLSAIRLDESAVANNIEIVEAVVAGPVQLNAGAPVAVHSRDDLSELIEHSSHEAVGDIQSVEAARRGARLNSTIVVV